MTSLPRTVEVEIVVREEFVSCSPAKNQRKTGCGRPRAMQEKGTGLGERIVVELRGTETKEGGTEE